MGLLPRLNAIASMVNKDAVLVDIGCDHGFLSIELVKDDIIKKAYASDVNIGPLNNVKSNVSKNGLDKKIDCILSDGLKEFKQIEFDTVVIAGMGGSLIVEILNENIELIKDKQLILQPNINSYGLRKWLLQNKFNIIDEKLVKDQDIIYEIIEVQSQKEVQYSELELMFGRINLNNKDELLIEFMIDNLKKLKDIVLRIPLDNEKNNEFQVKIQLIEEFLNEVTKFN